MTRSLLIQKYKSSYLLKRFETVTTIPKDTFSFDWTAALLCYHCSFLVWGENTILL